MDNILIKVTVKIHRYLKKRKNELLFLYTKQMFLEIIDLNLAMN